MTLILEPDVDMVKMYHHAKNKISLSTPSKVIARTDRHTHTHTHDKNITAYARGNKQSDV